MRGEAHIRHTVGLVDNDYMCFFEAHLIAIDEVGKPPRCCNGNVNTPPKVFDLAHHSRSAVERGHPTSLAASERSKRACDLLCEFPGRDQDECRRHPTVCLLHQLDDGQAVGEGLAGTGRRLAAKIAARQSVWQCYGLDGKGGIDTLLDERVDKARREAERSKCVHYSFRFFLGGRLASINPEVCRRLPYAAREQGYTPKSDTTPSSM